MPDSNVIEPIKGIEIKSLGIMAMARGSSARGNLFGSGNWYPDFMIDLVGAIEEIHGSEVIFDIFTTKYQDETKRSKTFLGQNLEWKTYIYQLQFLSRKWNRVYAQTRKHLSLKWVSLNEQKFATTLVDIFPSVEDLYLDNYSGMKKLNLVNYKLKKIKLFCGTLKDLDLTTPNLEYFEFVGYRLNPCRIKLGICKHLTFLTLGGVVMDNMMFADCDSNFPFLQALTIFGCDLTGPINISSNSLYRLSLLKFVRPVDVTIDCPNVRYFVYGGTRIVPFLNLNMPRLHKATLELLYDCTQVRNELWYQRYIDLLGGLIHAELLVIITNPNKMLVIPERYREIFVPPLVGFKKLVTWSTSLYKDYHDLIGSMVWLCPDNYSIMINCRDRDDISKYWE